MDFTELLLGFFPFAFLQETDLDSFELPPESFIIPMYNNNVNFCGGFLKKLGI